MTTEEAPVKGKRKKDVGLSKAEEARLMAAIETEKEKIVNQREEEEASNADLQDRWNDRYRCKVIAANRKGEKNLVMYVEHPARGIGKPYKLNIRLNDWIDEGLPMFVIQRIQAAYDSEADERDELPTGSAGNNHNIRKQPRFTVQLGKKIENPKVYK
jgi:hypothetical protein